MHVLDLHVDRGMDYVDFWYSTSIWSVPVVVWSVVNGCSLSVSYLQYYDA